MSANRILIVPALIAVLSTAAFAGPMAPKMESHKMMAHPMMSHKMAGHKMMSHKMKGHAKMKSHKMAGHKMMGHKMGTTKPTPMTKPMHKM